MSSPSVCTREVIVNLENGLHMSPSAQIVQTAQAYPCEVLIRKGDKAVDGKSMLDVLTLAAEKGSTLVLEASGEQAEEAIEALDQLFKTNFTAG